MFSATPGNVRAATVAPTAAGVDVGITARNAVVGHCGLVTGEELRRLVDALPDGRLDAVSEVVRAAADPGLTCDAEAEPVRTFASAGTLSVGDDLAERGPVPSCENKHSQHCHYCVRLFS
jgi:hypothetical protein